MTSSIWCRRPAPWIVHERPKVWVRDLQVPRGYTSSVPHSAHKVMALTHVGQAGSQTLRTLHHEIPWGSQLVDASWRCERQGPMCADKALAVSIIGQAGGVGICRSE